MSDTTDSEDFNRRLYAALLASMASSTGANAAMGVPGMGSPGGPPLQVPPSVSANNTGYFAGPVGGPNSPLIAPSYAPSGVIFGGGSPFPVNPWPARINNALVGLRDLMNTPLGQELIAGLKVKAPVNTKSTL